ncbi:MAG: TonB-dependent receptor [Proteobacteria bacterium]|nr:TonB-dependent receptor [Pseudomonadota bacterium]
MARHLTIRSRKLVLMGAVCLLAPALLERAAARNQAAATGSADASSEQAGPVTLEQVVVTATKQSETLQNTPVGLTLITSERIGALGIQDFNDYMQYVPSLQISSEGGTGLGVPIIRGLYSGPEQTTSTVGIYVDDMPLTPSSAGFPGTLVMPDPDLADVRNIEVLKGPQGTLYGASSLGGLVRIVTAKPSLERFSGEAGISGSAVDGGGDGYGVHSWVNIPLIGHELALRVSAFDRLDPGFMTNVLTHQDNVNTARVKGGAATLRFAPTARLDIDFNASYQDIHNNSLAGSDLNAQTLQPLEGKYQYAAFTNTNIDTSFLIGNVTATYRLDAGTITDSTSYARYNSAQVFDYTTLYGPLLAFVSPEAVFGHIAPRMNKYTEELRFNSSRIGAFSFLGGLYYTYERDTYGFLMNGVDGFNGAPLPVPLYGLLTADTTNHYDEYAAYGDVTWHFAHRWDATAGIRESHNSQSGATSGGGLLAGGSGDSRSRSANSDTTYLATVKWRPVADLTAYLRAASGYRPGGPQFSAAAGVPSSFGPDTVWDYEGGVKGAWLDGRLSADADVYRMNWRDIQLNALVNGLTVTGNGGNAHSQGVEFQGQYAPLHGLVLSANAAYDETRIDSISANSDAGAQVGDPLPNTPKWSGALAADYSAPIGRAVGTVGATYHYQGAASSSFSGINSYIDARIPAYSEVDLRTGLEWGRYRLMFRVSNLLDKYALSNITLSQLIPGDPFDPVYGSGVPLQPRTYQLSLEARF